MAKMRSQGVPIALGNRCWILTSQILRPAQPARLRCLRPAMSEKGTTAPVRGWPFVTGSDKQRVPAARAGTQLSSPSTNPASSAVLLTGSAFFLTRTKKAVARRSLPRHGHSKVRGFLRRGHLPKRVLGLAAVPEGGSSAGSFAASAAEKRLGCLSPAASAALPPLLPNLFLCEPQVVSLWREDRLPVVFFLFFFFQAQSTRTKKKDNQIIREC